MSIKKLIKDGLDIRKGLAANHDIEYMYDEHIQLSPLYRQLGKAIIDCLAEPSKFDGESKIQTLVKKRNGYFYLSFRVDEANPNFSISSDSWNAGQLHVHSCYIAHDRVPGLIQWLAERYLTERDCVELLLELE